jgi:exodeoxyribonuclease VII small subunit
VVAKKEGKTNSDAVDHAPAQRLEQALDELERIVTTMESGDLSLEASIDAYQKGVALAKACQQQLQQAEQRVRVLEADLLRPLEPTQIAQPAADD